MSTTDWVAGAGDVYNGITAYDQGQTREYHNRATTDSNGRVTLYLTTTGLLAGTALFSKILSIQVAGVYNNTENSRVTNFYVEQEPTDFKTLVVRCSQVGLSLLGILTVNFGSAGIPCYVTVKGLP